MNQNIFKKFALLLTMVIMVFSLSSIVYATDYSGRINSLSTDKASYENPDETIIITCQVQNTGSNTIPAGSQIVYEISVGGTGVRSQTSTISSAIPPGGVYTDSWSTTNSGFPSASTYTLEASWYDDWHHNPGHHLDTKTTTFYSVPSPWLIVALAGFLMAVAVLARKKRWWLTFYLTGAVALVALIVSFFIITGYDTYIMAIEAKNIAYFSTILGIPANFLPPNGFIFPDTTGWSIFGIGFECSCLIEISVLIGLLLLYPGYSYKRKMKYAGIGIVATYGANLIRMLSIIFIVYVFGKSTLYFAHAFVGKIIFFAFVIVLYWYLLTRPTLNIVRDNIKSGKFED